MVVDGDGDEGHNDDDVIDALFVSLQHPVCGVENLDLRALRLGSPSDITSTHQANHNLRVLELHEVYIATHKSVSLLWQLVGLKKLHVTVPRVDEDDDPDCWAEHVRRNPSLSSLFITDSNWVDCAKGLVSGACGHESLKLMELNMSGSSVYLDLRVGGELCRLLK
jgi:hypothetical protein